ncbi:MAG: hypothetical protein QM589_16940 [Thermomicrobiales bacterium]
MHQRNDDGTDVRTFVLAGSVIGLAFVMIPLVIFASRLTDESAGQNLRSALFLVAIGWPFALGFVTRWWPRDLQYKRFAWLLCFLGVPVPAYFLLGFGIFLIAVALVYPWAFWMTRTSFNQHDA